MKSLLLLFCFPVLVAAQSEAQTAPRSYQLKDGTVIRAEITSVDQAQDRVEYRFFAGGGSGVTARPLSAFSVHSQFNILRAVLDENDIEARVHLASFAVDNGLIAAGKRELFKARDMADEQGMEDVDPDLEARIMDEAVKALDGLLRGLLDEGKMKDADYVLHEILAGPRITDAQKDHFSDLVETKSKQVEDAKAQSRASARAAELSAEKQRLLQPVQQRLQRGKDLQNQALRNLGNQSQALSAYNGAVREFDMVMRDAERLTQTHSNDQDLLAEVSSLSQQAQDEKISVLLSQASIYTTRSSFNQAMGVVGQVLAIDSQNQQALNMRARIEIAANSDGGFIGGRPVGGTPTGRIR